MSLTISELAAKVDEVLEHVSKPTFQSKRWLRTEEASEYLSISRSQLHKLKADGRISVSKLGGTNYYDREEIDKILEEGKVL